MTESASIAVQELVTALYLYPNYRVDSRGPRGCLLRAIRELDPQIHQELINSSADEVFQKHYAETAPEDAEQSKLLRWSEFVLRAMGAGLTAREYNQAVYAILEALFEWAT